MSWTNTTDISYSASMERSSFHGRVVALLLECSYLYNFHLFSGNVLI